VTLKLAVSRSRPLVPYGANFYFRIIISRQRHSEAAAPELEVKIADLDLDLADEGVPLTDAERLEDER